MERKPPRGGEAPLGRGKSPGEGKPPWRGSPRGEGKPSREEKPGGREAPLGRGKPPGKGKPSGKGNFLGRAPGRQQGPRRRPLGKRRILPGERDDFLRLVRREGGRRPCRRRRPQPGRHSRRVKSPAAKVCAFGGSLPEGVLPLRTVEGLCGACGAGQRGAGFACPAWESRGRPRKKRPLLSHGSARQGAALPRASVGAVRGRLCAATKGEKAAGPKRSRQRCCTAGPPARGP